MSRYPILLILVFTISIMGDDYIYNSNAAFFNKPLLASPSVKPLKSLNYNFKSTYTKNDFELFSSTRNDIKSSNKNSGKINKRLKAGIILTSIGTPLIVLGIIGRITARYGYGGKIAIPVLIVGISMETIGIPFIISGCINK